MRHTVGRNKQGTTVQCVYEGDLFCLLHEELQCHQLTAAEWRRQHQEARCCLCLPPPLSSTRWFLAYVKVRSNATHGRSMQTTYQGAYALEILPGLQTKLTTVSMMPCIPFGPHKLRSVGSYLIDTAIWLTDNRLQGAKLLANLHFAAYSM